MLRILLLALATLTRCQRCPPPEVLFPCECMEDLDTQMIHCIGIEENLNLKVIFNNASDYIDDQVVFEYLEISETSITEIEEDAIPHLKFEKLFIKNNPNLTYISPSAFTASLNTTWFIVLENNYIGNAAPFERDIFDFISSFKGLVYLYFNDESITSLPDNAFQNLDSLVSILLYSNRITNIGSRVFSGCSKLINLVLQGNSIPSTGLPMDAFIDIGSSLKMVDLSCNKMNFMEQKVFQPLLDQTGLEFLVGGGCFEASTFDRFYCDERAEWICENEESYRNKLSGYLCNVESDFLNIWEYCKRK